MLQEEPNSPAESKEPVAKTDWAALLSSEDLENLAGFFDVLIEMDLEQELLNKKGEDDAKQKISEGSDN